MKNNLYCIYNKLSQRYGDCYCFASDALAVRRLPMAPMYKGVIDEIEICRVASIDIETGLVTSEAPVRIAIPDDILAACEPAPVASVPVDQQSNS